MSRTRDIFLTVAAAVVILQGLAFGDTGRAIAQTVQQVFVTNTSTQPVPVKVSGTTGVKVYNADTAPVWVRDVDKARQPFQARFDFTINATSYGWAGLSAVTVPARKRLVLEYVSFRMTLPQGQNPQDGPTIEVTNSGQTVEYQLPPMTYNGS